jgi:Contractile injection system tube protein
VPDASNLAKAELRQLDSTFAREIEKRTWCTVQFNPESLKVSFANQLVQPSGAGDQRGSPARQFVGAGTTKLALTLWFDVGSPQPPGSARVDDVRKLTKKVAFFITPKPVPGQRDKFVPPAVRFVWGSFQFDGLMESLEETLEYFSPQGKPLRASLALGLSQQKIQFAFRDTGAGPAGAGGGAGPGAPGATPGTQPLAQAPAGSTVQSLADDAGKGDWQSIAAANGIENPRLLAPGALLDLNVQAPQLGLELGVEGGFGVGVQAGIGLSGPQVSVGIGTGG